MVRLFLDGKQWCARLDNDSEQGVIAYSGNVDDIAGFSNTASDALRDLADRIDRDIVVLEPYDERPPKPFLDSSQPPVVITCPKCHTPFTSPLEMPEACICPKCGEGIVLEKHHRVQ
jgi:hypothetical protein